MKNIWFGIVLIGFGIYRASAGDWLEFAMYCSVGLGFSLMAAIRANRLEGFRKILEILSWVFVILGVILFIAVLRSDAYSL